MKTVCVSFARGCPRSELDATLIIDYFKANGWRVTNKFKEADLVLVNSCAFSGEVEEESMEYLSIASRKKRKDAPLITFGCMAQISRERILRDTDIIPLTRSSIHQLDGMIQATVKLGELQDANITREAIRTAAASFTWLDRVWVNFKLWRDVPVKGFLRALAGRPTVQHSDPSKDVFNIRVGIGCLSECSYCAIRRSCGVLHSKPLETICAEFETGVAEGHRTISLIGEDVGSYGQDTGTNIADLMRVLLSHGGDYQLSVTDFGPRWLVKHFPDLLEVISENADRIEFLEFPLQSGSEKIIRAMNRGYSVKEAAECILALQRVAPGVPIRTHFIVGFPGETDEDFEQTMELARSIPFEDVSIYRYSDRPGTDASLLPNKIPAGTINRRFKMLCRECASCKDTWTYRAHRLSILSTPPPPKETSLAPPAVDAPPSARG